MNGLNLTGLKLINDVPGALLKAIGAACQEYANGGFRAQPIVREHFTQGNKGRYGWPPLSASYAKEKAGQTKQLKKNMKASGKVVPKGAGLPMLVRTGALRDSISGGRAKISRTGTGFMITWANVPEYAIFLHQGTPKMPKRSPIEPNASDNAKVISAANRYLHGFLGLNPTGL